MKRIITLNSAWDKTDSDPKKNYGIHGVELRMVLKGKHGATQFVLYTNWQLPEVTERMRKEMTPDKHFLFEPLPADKGYHSLKPIYEGQSIINRPCEYLNGKPCYYDGSGLNAESLYEILLREGSEGVWKNLEEYYVELFGKLE